jgi:hypothetical protein
MRRVVTVALLTSLLSAPGCAMAVKHPAVTAGVVVGTLGLGTCELASSDQKACFGISGAAGIGMALITAAALWLGYEDAEPAPAQAADPSNLAPGPVYVPSPDQTPAPAKPAPPPPAPAPAPAPAPSDPAPPSPPSPSPAPATPAPVVPATPATPPGG